MALTRVTKTGNITVDGNVGIETGTVTPRDVGASTLQIGGNGTRSAIKMHTSSSGTGSTDGLFLGYDSGPDFYILNSEANGQVKIGTNNSPGRLVIDSSGNVTTPNQPAFYATSTSADINISSTTATNFNVTRVNAGNHYSTSTKRFTAPVSGTYYFECVIQVHAVSTGGHIHALGVGLLKNGNAFKDQYHGNSGTTNYITVNCNAMIYLGQSDYVTSRIQPGTSIDVEYTGGTDRCHFSGYLIG